MRIRSFHFKTLLITLWGGWLLSAATLQAAEKAAPDDATIHQLIIELAESSSSTRQAAVNNLVHTGDTRLIAFFDFYRSGSLYLLDGLPVASEETTSNADLDEFALLLDVLSGEPILGDDGRQRVVPLDELEEVDANRKARMLVRSAKFLLGLADPDPVNRQIAVKRCGDPPRQMVALGTLRDIMANDPVAKIRYVAEESIQLLMITDPDLDWSERDAAAARLGEMKSGRALPVLSDLIRDEELPKERGLLFAAAVENIERYGSKIKFFDNMKFGLSTGSILILMALGLSITFGLMGVINMAHGELMMIGAYTTFMMQGAFGHTPDTPNNMFFIFALPAAFLMAAFVGFLIEYFVVRFLYKRPLESLLATYGVSLILIQGIRLIFGDNQASNSPTWLMGNFEVFQDMTLSLNRVFIFVLTAVTVLLIHVLMRYTALGLKMRATMQNRNMAASMGINTRAVDAATFSLGAGLAGIAGYALTTVSGITPDMGQNYIVDSFLVVVTGGVGEMLGVICSGFGLGMLNKILEGTFFGPVWSKIIILGVVVTFIQFKPAGLFPPKGRLADV